MTHMQRGLFRDPSCCLVNWAHTIRPPSPRASGNNVGFYRHLAMTLPSQSQFDSALTKTDLAEIFKCRKIRTTGALLRIRSSREAAAARQPDRMGQRHSLRPVRPRSRPGPLATGPYVVFLQQSGRYLYWSFATVNRAARCPPGSLGKSYCLAPRTRDDHCRANGPVSLQWLYGPVRQAPSTQRTCFYGSSFG